MRRISLAQLRTADLLLATLLPALLAGVLLAALTRPAVMPDAGRTADLRLHNVTSVEALDGWLGLPQPGGLRNPVARSSVRRLPPDWPQQSPQPAERQRFVRVVLPLVLAANEAIAADRRRLQAAIAAGARLPVRERRWLQALAQRYGASPAQPEALLQRVDAIPPSLALAQAIVESGWGRSRFARQGNALFGQWTWQRGAGVRPNSPRANKGDYAVRSFRDLYAATVHYMLNLNRHTAYAAFRRQRARLRASGKPPSGTDLAAALTAYSERGAANVALIRTVIRQNRLGPLDRARLAPPA